MRHRSTTVLISLLTLLPPLHGRPDAPDLPAPSVDEVLRYLGFEASAKRDLLAGKILQSGIREGEDTELAVTVAMAVPCRVAKMVEAFKTGRTFEADRDVLTFRDLGAGPVRDEDLAPLSWSREESGEIRALLSAEPGSRFNLSEAEIEAFRTIARRFKKGSPEKDPACAEEVAKGLRRMLQDRLRAYQERGMKGIVPYARGGREQSSPGTQLRSAAEAAALLGQHFPAFYRNFLGFPEGAAKEFEHRFYWIKERVEGRPAFVLAHRTFHQRPDGALITERQFYVGHSYNCLQIVMGCLPAGEKTLVFYTNRTFTDQVTGFAAGLRHSIGRKKMLGKIVSSFEEMREQAKREGSGK